MRRSPAASIGQRTVKSAVSVGICFLIYLLRGRTGVPFYSAIAALQCMQAYQRSTRQMALQRFLGTCIGAFYGLLLVLFQRFVLDVVATAYLLYCALVMLGVVASLCTAVALQKKNAAYFSCVVFLSTSMSHIGDADPYLFVCNRMLDTVIGIVIGMGVNAFHLPRRKNRDVLFVTALDDVLLARNATLSDVCRVKLNRMLDEGPPFSIMTMRAPASFLEAAGEIRLRYPLIVMDGAALYDCANNAFLAKCELPYEEAVALTRTLEELGLGVYQNAIMENSVLIFYQTLTNDVARQIHDRLQKSPYRNYIARALPQDTPVAYLMTIDTDAQIDAAYRLLQARSEEGNYRLLCYPSDDYPGYSYLKIYHKDATKKNMLGPLQEATGFAQVRTFGSVPGLYDEYVQPANGDDVVHILKREFEPYIWQK